MKVIRIHITGWVASFRNPLFISGFQPTLPMPPLSVIYGIITAAKGEWVTPHDVSIGFVFRSNGKAVDLETVYEFAGKLDAKSNINRREFLVDPELYLYIPEMQLKEAFERPRYPLLLGRSSDLATVESIAEIELEGRSETSYQDTLLPFPDAQLYGQVQALPTHFTAEIPRRPCGTRAYCLITERIQYTGNVLHDPDKNWGVYLHERIPGEFTVPTEQGKKPVDKDYKVPDVTGKQMQFPGI
ncbi:type I-B CRISPR-associated protein Cas5 [Candidatus Poribacteria bacterium]|nr:type I-B CRISPR-associated protein Cas5 [Candidatus Poribacteria bacterium]MYG08987.1 type I-B CRISPR-associated protein Cas5 [Candidatus Poribacteria bacterium]MYK22851.1 type I-B CRISPR-associated protein Cas5 [Candidatus Poribacteria bacterium]